jgi:hypothetical protein
LAFVIDSSSINRISSLAMTDMSQLDVEHDPFLTLLTDALRAGPGSPQWHDAVAQLKDSKENVDEYKLLIEAREALESGKDFRSVRAGDGFTRKLMGQIDQDQPRSAKRLQLGTLIAIAAGIVLIAIIGIAIYVLYPRTPVDDTQKAIADLASIFFPNELSSSTFDSAIPGNWRAIGSLPLETSAQGLKAGGASVPQGDYVGGGIVMNDPIQPGQAVSIQTTVLVTKPGDDLIPQVFLSGSSDFSADRAISSRELVWQIQGGLQKVVVDGRVAKQAGLNSKTNSHSVRFILKGDLAIVECDGRQLFAGHSELADKPRYLGVRFLRTGQKPTADISIQSVRVMAANG